MTRLNASNNASTRLVADVTATDTFFDVENASPFPDPPFRVWVNEEIIEVGAIDRVANRFSNLIRGVENTTPAFHPVGSFVENVFTAGTYQELVDAINSKETPEGAQQKANQAETNAKNHTDGLIGALSSLLTNTKNTIVAAINEIVTSLNEKVSKSGDTMTGSLNTTSAFPFYIKLSGKKTWGFHRSGDNLYIAPSASNDGTDLDWSKQTVFYPDGKVSFSGIVDAKGNTSYTTRQMRSIILSTADPNVSAMQDGDIWIKYK